MAIEKMSKEDLAHLEDAYPYEISEEHEKKMKKLKHRQILIFRKIFHLYRWVQHLLHRQQMTWLNCGKL